MRGAFLGEAFVKGFGLARVFEDLLYTDQFYIIGIKHDRRGWVNRRELGWRKPVKR